MTPYGVTPSAQTVGPHGGDGIRLAREVGVDPATIVDPVPVCVKISEDRSSEILTQTGIGDKPTSW